MLDDDFLDSLPDDPDEGLASLYRSLKSKLAQDEEQDMLADATAFNLEASRRTMLNIVFAYLAAHDLELNVSRSAPQSSEQFEFYFKDTIESIEFYIARTSFERSKRNRGGNSAIYVLSTELKARIHRYLTSIRTIISESTLSDTKRTTLSKKLNAFADEVDRDKTRIEALASAMIWTRKEVVEGAEGLEPIVEKLDKMFQSFTKATEFFRSPTAGGQKQIPAPQKRIEGPSSKIDDEVPF
jgi:hypothetical protein